MRVKVKVLQRRRTNRLRTSRRLQRELARYSIDRLPSAVQDELYSAMSNPSFEPDKLAEALEHARATSEVEKDKNEELSFEKCPWYETVGRILMLLGLALVLYIFFCWCICVCAITFDRVTGNSLMEMLFSLMQNHPSATIITSIIGYVLVFFIYIYMVAKQMQTSLFYVPD